MHDSASLNPGDQVDGLHVERVLGTSAHAATYLVTDAVLGKRFVLKECLPASAAIRHDDGKIRPAGADHEATFNRALEEFRSAGRLLAELDHPNMARVVRLFESLGTAYCLMEWQNGECLSVHLDRHGPLDTEATRALLSQMAGAIAALHEAGGLHLGICPDNIFLRTDGAAVLLDLRRASAYRSKRTVRVEETPYTPPELTGTEPSPCPASDIYGLCAVAYHCLTGHAPIPAGDRSRALARGEPDPLETVARQVAGGALGGLGDAVDLGLRLRASERPQGIAEWQQALESIDWRRTIASTPAAPADRERPEWLSPMLLGGLLAVLAIAVAYLLLWRGPPSTGRTEEPQSTPPAAPAIAPEETRQWQTALQADTVLAYRRFMQAYPESPYRNQADVQLDILDERYWAELSEENTLSAYTRYLELFPGGQHQAEALREIDRIEQALSAEERARRERERQDNADWLEARDGNSLASLDRYLDKWPSGLHVNEAHALRDALKARELESRAWAAAVKLNSQDAYQAYLDAYPNGAHSAEALITLEHLDLGPGKAFRDCPACPPMMVLPAGEFWQGSDGNDETADPDEQPRHVVRIDRPFAIGVHEVTFDQWDACVTDGGCRHDPPDNGWGRGDQPLIMVSWNDAQEYVVWLSEKTRQEYRLPSESEWEYAARAGQEGPWPGGAPEQLCRYANIAGAETNFRWRLEGCEDAQALGTLPVGSLAPNSFGIHDMIGNVAEWTADCMNISYLDAPADGSAWGRGICSSHMTRGGSWVTGPREARLPARFSLDSGDRNDFTGFRVVRSVED